MKNDKTMQMSDSFLIASVLSLTGGYLNCYTYLNRGAVFATAETGNLCLMGMKLAQGLYSDALYYLIPICSFALGILSWGYGGFPDRSHFVYEDEHFVEYKGCSSGYCISNDSISAAVFSRPQ